MDWITTSTIIERLRADDRSIWESFSRRFRPALMSFARRLGLSDADAEEVTQDTLLAFSQSVRAGQYERDKGRLSKWLFGIAHNQIANLRRKRGREHAKRDPRGAHISFWDDVPGEDALAQTWDAEWEKAQLEACVAQLRRESSEKLFRVFEIVVRESRPTDDAAAELGMTRDAVYVAKHRALKRLGELMRDFDELLPSG